jgi:hypothetical protein
MGRATPADPEVSAVLQVLEDMPDGVVGVEPVGDVTDVDYEQVPTTELDATKSWAAG